MTDAELIEWAKKSADWARFLVAERGIDRTGDCDTAARMLDAIADRLEAVMRREAQQ